MYRAREGAQDTPVACNPLSFQSLETRDDLTGLSMTPKLRFLEDWPTVDGYLEASATRRNQLDRGVGELLLDLGRQPGGPWLVASKGAVFDRDAHDDSGLNSSLEIATHRPPHGAIGTPARLATRRSTLSCLAMTVRSEST